MKINRHQINQLSAMQIEYDLSAHQVARMAFRRFGVRVSRQCIFKRLNALSMEESALAR
jgi:hypothetical protein